MDHDWHIKTVLHQIKQGVDAFNTGSSELKAGYPEFVDIEHCGVALRIPFTFLSEQG